MQSLLVGTVRPCRRRHGQPCRSLPVLPVPYCARSQSALRPCLYCECSVQARRQCRLRTGAGWCRQHWQGTVSDPGFCRSHLTVPTACFRGAGCLTHEEHFGQFNQTLVREMLFIAWHIAAAQLSQPSPDFYYAIGTVHVY